MERIELHISTDSLQSARYSDILSQLSDSAEYYMYDDVEEQITVTSKEDIKILLETPSSVVFLPGQKRRKHGRLCEYRIYK